MKGKKINSKFSICYIKHKPILLAIDTTMVKSGFLLFFNISFIFFLGVSLFCNANINDEERKVYIVYMGSCVEGDTYKTTAVHFSMLQQVIGESSVKDVLVRNYKRSINGFAAKLTDQEAKRLAGMNGVVSVFPNTILYPQTTRSWNFIGLNETVKRNPAVESNITIGVIDSGIWPESESFSEKGFGPPPPKWKGVCNGGRNFTCNNKLIGARYYTGDSARDEVGHGSHTASTAAGNPVKGASFFGLGEGTAMGGVPSARIAAYKVCNEDGCPSEGILAAFDDAIADGVDLFTVSLSFQNPRDFKYDTIAIGAFHALEKGILTVQAAGNTGDLGEFSPTPSVAPWVLSVAASSIDRQFISKVVLGNGKMATGLAVNSFTLNGTKFPLVPGEDVANDYCHKSLARNCANGCLVKELVQGKILLCNEFWGIKETVELGAVGAIVYNNLNDTVPRSEVVPLPVTTIDRDNFTFVETYVNNTKNPTAEILKSETIKDPEAPRIAYFSSRGPNALIPDVLKPDLSAPGVDILAAYSPLASPSGYPQDTRQAKYAVFSGTSMACPHAAAAALYVKTFHPDWSASAIKSALMTTSSFVEPNSVISPGQGLAYSSGNINPVKAIDPGLVYETSKEDYIQVLCSIGYDSKTVRIISGDNSSCPEGSKNASARDLNYPSLAAQVPINKPFKLEFHRTVTNVGSANSTYKVETFQKSKHSVNVTVVPEVLSFKSINEKKSFNVIVTGEGLKEFDYVATDLVWSDGGHVVISPIVIHSYTFNRNTLQ